MCFQSIENLSTSSKICDQFFLLVHKSFMDSDFLNTLNWKRVFSKIRKKKLNDLILPIFLLYLYKIKLFSNIYEKKSSYHFMSSIYRFNSKESIIYSTQLSKYVYLKPSLITINYISNWNLRN